MVRQEDVNVPYIADKRTGRDIEQFSSLPPEVQAALVYGDDEQARAALEAIRRQEQVTGETILGEAGLEFANDLRSSRQK